ncbi:MAG: LytTR family DNA-binding domain-containing protein [Bacteroidota bacterium]
MNAKKEIVFWVTVLILLNVIFSGSFQRWQISFYFVAMLFPVVLGTSLFFNRFLVPKYLLANRRLKFVLYLCYLLIVSVYFELLVVILALAILANYKVENLGEMASNAYLLTAVMYLIVLVDGFISILRKLKDRNAQLLCLEEERAKNANSSIIIKVNRKNIPIDIADILLVESLSDYVKVHTVHEEYITKQKISALEALLPDSFLRIHRSFLVNQSYIEAFNRESITIKGQAYPIGRTYKQQCLDVLMNKEDQSK